MTDEETKITEFEYENYINKNLLKHVNTKSDDFKHLVRALHLFSRTEYESLQEAKENFKDLMPVVRGLNEDEVKTLIHKIRNSSRKYEGGSSD